MWFLIALLAVLAALTIYDLIQRKHAILRNFPIIGHFRYWLESVGPELRQYIVTNNDEERPFSRDQRRWVYTSAKKQNRYFGFGSDNEMELSPNYLIVRHAALPLAEPEEGEPGGPPLYELPAAKVLGGYRGRRRAFRPDSLVNISAMSFGSLSSAAITALNRGSAAACCLHNTGEGGVSRYHLNGGDLIWQLGTGYFGCRNEDGTFSLERLVDVTRQHEQIRAIEIKLSQGAKPGRGGILPGKKVTPEIARIRGIPVGRDCFSPASHSAFRDADELLDFVETIAEATGLPVGIKSAVGQDSFFKDLARLCATTDRGVDFIAVDGGEGGTGAAPLAYSDHVSLPFKIAMTRVYRVFALQDMHEKIVFIGAGRLGFPVQALFAMSLGCDMISVAREAMMAIGCIQAQRCHTGHCPTGVATHNRWLVRGLDPTSKADRLTNYVMTLRKELLALARACGEIHPALVHSRHFEILDDHFSSSRIWELFGYEPGYGLPSEEDREAITALMLSSGSQRGVSTAASGE